MKPDDLPQLPSDQFVPLASAEPAEDVSFEALSRRPMRPVASMPVLAPMVGRLQGFDPLERPLVGGLHTAPGGVFSARTTVGLKRAMRGCEVLVVFEDGAIDKPVIVGVVKPHALQDTPSVSLPTTSVVADGDRQTIEAERELVLKCGDASITLTRAGKVIIHGNYVLSRSTGYNKIKGAAIDIN